MRACRVFEPKDEILTEKDFSRELLKYKKRAALDLTIVEESMKPIVLIDGTQYICELGEANLEETENPFQRAFGMVNVVNKRKIVKMQLNK